MQAQFIRFLHLRAGGGLPVPAPIVFAGGSGGQQAPRQGDSSIFQNSYSPGAKKRYNEW